MKNIRGDGELCAENSAFIADEQIEEGERLDSSIYHGADDVGWEEGVFSRLASVDTETGHGDTEDAADEVAGDETRCVECH